MTPTPSATLEIARTSGVHRIDEGAASAFRAELPSGAPLSSSSEQVTLVVYGWKSVEPGTLSWVFPSVGAALIAARTMTNAVNWIIIEGSARHGAIVDIPAARARGAVLVER